MQREKLILKNLLKNEEFIRKVLPFLKEEYFQADDDKTLFKVINDFVLKYNVSPTQDAVLVEINKPGLSEAIVRSVSSSLKKLSDDPDDPSFDWLLNETEAFCQDRAIHNALIKSIEIANGETSLTKGAIPQLLMDAIAVTFDPSVGHDYFEQSDVRYEKYHEPLEKIPFDLDYFNKMTNGGVQKGTLNVALGGTGVGKSFWLCHLAASYLTQGKNVLYITLELSDIEVAKRIDANLMGMNVTDLMTIPKQMYEQRISSLRAKTDGKLIVKRYPGASASVVHFRALLNELRIKKKFRPDVILVDYLNICSSSRMKKDNNGGSFAYVLAIAEELRGLAVECDVPMHSATQINRAGLNNTDVGLENTSESIGLAYTADFMFALISTPELEAIGQLLIKQLKNRYGDPNKYQKFVVGIDRSKMRFFDADQLAQSTLINEPVVQQPKLQTGSTKFLDKNKFRSIKVT